MAKQDLNEKCFLCGKNLHNIFMTTPLLETEPGIYEHCCEKCADKICRDWDEEDKKYNL